MARRGPEPTPGIVVVDKPAGWTSHDVVARVRRLAGTSKVGHAGTLDPMATGVLVLGIGRATKLLTFIVGHDKAYEATIRLGESTVTDDAEGEVLATVDASGIEADALVEGVSRLTGDIAQRPSAVSAIKIDGKRAYARVRGGEDVTLPERPVTVSRFEIRDVRRSGTVVDVDVAVEVSSGTYVRALARDLGDYLGVGGHLTALRRTRVGGFDISEARTLDHYGSVVDAGETLPRISLTDAACAVLPVVVVTDAQAAALSYGNFIDDPRTSGAGEAAAPVVVAGATAVAVANAGTPGAQAIAVVERRGQRLKPTVVFAPAQ